MRVCRLRALAGELRDVIKFNFNQKVLGSMELFKEKTHGGAAMTADQFYGLSAVDGMNPDAACLALRDGWMACRGWKARED